MYYAKQLIKDLHNDKSIALFCDLHGHSRAHGSFVYGCEFDDEPELTRLYPYLLSKLSPHFSFAKSRFNVEQSKAKTARVSLFKELGNVPAVYTLEASFADTLDGVLCTPKVLKELGRDICRALICYCGIRVGSDSASGLGEYVLSESVD